MNLIKQIIKFFCPKKEKPEWIPKVGDICWARVEMGGRIHYEIMGFTEDGDVIVRNANYKGYPAEKGGRLIRSLNNLKQ